jgi:hypothetical protein
MSMVAAIRTLMSAPEKSICFTSCTRRIWTAANLSKTARGLQSRQHLSQSCRRKLEEEFLQRVVLLVICVSDLYKEWLFMNRREALMAAAGSIAAVVAIPSVASAETAETEDDNPELAPIRALLDAYDSGVLVVLGSPPCRRPKLGFGSIGGALAAADGSTDGAVVAAGGSTDGVVGVAVDGSIGGDGYAESIRV